MEGLDALPLTPAAVAVAPSQRLVAADEASSDDAAHAAAESEINFGQ